MTQVGGDFHDPVTINLRRQAQVLFEQIPTSSPHRNLLQNPSTKHDLLSTLSSLLAIPSLTIHTATAFRPLLLDLCSRWLLDADRLDDKLEAFGLLLEIHPEIFP